MDIEFTVQDIFAVTRPQWKLAANMEEAAKAFHQAVAQDQKSVGLDKNMDADDAMSDPSSDDDNVDVDDIEALGEVDDDSASDEEELEVWTLDLSVACK
jgi:regulator of nonsense transcripts 2